MSEQRFRKKPVVIEAMRFDRNAYLQVADWCGGRLVRTDNNRVSFLVIPTLEGDMRAEKGDWVIRGVQGEFYPCKPEIFAATYEAVLA